jgi:acetate CoA/acetoacetate CoA-transferase alpha subunit
VGTIVADGKDVIKIDGRDYLLEKPLHADFALIRASKIDKFGNSVFYGTTKNFNPMMATAADYVIAGACEIVETGSIDPNVIHISGIFVNAIVGGEKPWQM